MNWAKTVLMAAKLALLFSNFGNALDFARDTLYEPSLTGNPVFTTTKTNDFPPPIEVIDSIRYEAAPGTKNLGYLPELLLNLDGKDLICRQGGCENVKIPGRPPLFHEDTLISVRAPFTLAFLGMESCVSSCPVIFSDCPCACQNAALFVAHVTFITRVPGGNPRVKTGIYLMGDSYSCAASYVNPFATIRLSGKGAVSRPVRGMESRCGCLVNGRKSGSDQRRIR